MFKCSRKQPMHTGRSRALAGCFTGETENISDSRKQENYDQMERTSAVILNQVSGLIYYLHREKRTEKVRETVTKIVEKREILVLNLSNSYTERNYNELQAKFWLVEEKYRQSWYECTETSKCVQTNESKFARWREQGVDRHHCQLLY